MNDNQCSFLFTYGTLMRGFENPLVEILEKETDFVGKGYMSGLLYKISWFPGALYLPDGDKKVYGEVLKIGAVSLLPLLDDYEDIADGLYERKIIPVIMEDQRVLNCWAYLYNQPLSGFELISSGNFRIG